MHPRGVHDEERLAAALRQAADVQGVEPVHVLLVVDGAEDALLVDMVRHGELDQDAVDVWVRVVGGDHLEHLLLGGVPGKVRAEGLDAGLSARLLLAANVRLRVLAVAHEDDGEAWDEGEGRGDEREGRGRQGSDVRARCEKQGFGRRGRRQGREAQGREDARGVRGRCGERTGTLPFFSFISATLTRTSSRTCSAMALPSMMVRPRGRLGERASGGRADGAGAAPEGRGRGDLPPEGGGGGGGGHRDSEDVYARAGGDGVRAERRAQP